MICIAAISQHACTLLPPLCCLCSRVLHTFPVIHSRGCPALTGVQWPGAGCGAAACWRGRHHGVAASAGMASVGFVGCSIALPSRLGPSFWAPSSKLPAHSLTFRSLTVTNPPRSFRCGRPALPVMHELTRPSMPQLGGMAAPQPVAAGARRPPLSRRQCKPLHAVSSHPPLAGSSRRRWCCQR